MAHHKDLTGSDLHEPKGAASASSGQVYVANGSGSGVWTAVKGSYVALNVLIDDVSTAADVYIGVPVAGTVSKIIGVLGAAINTADSNVTFSKGGVSIDTSAMVVAQSGSAAGTEFSSTPSGHNTMAVGDVIKCSTDGGSTGTAKFWITLLINVS